MPPLTVSARTTVLPSALELGAQDNGLTASLDSVTDGITATGSGNQSSALLIVSKMNRITTVTGAGDAVRLPPAIAGLSIIVRNAATTNAANVYPSSATQGGVSGGDQINAGGQNNAYSLTVAANTIIFRCFTTGTWFTL